MTKLVGVLNPLIMSMSSVKFMNKVFNIELCQEDAQRIILALDSYKDKCEQVINQCMTEEQKSAAWLEWSYVSELAYMMEDVLDVDQW